MKINHLLCSLVLAALPAAKASAQEFEPILETTVLAPAPLEGKSVNFRLLHPYLSVALAYGKSGKFFNPEVMALGTHFTLGLTGIYSERSIGDQAFNFTIEQGQREAVERVGVEQIRAIGLKTELHFSGTDQDGIYFSVGAMYTKTWGNESIRKKDGVSLVCSENRVYDEQSVVALPMLGYQWMWKIGLNINIAAGAAVNRTLERIEERQGSACSSGQQASSPPLNQTSVSPWAEAGIGIAL